MTPRVIVCSAALVVRSRFLRRQQKKTDTRETHGLLQCVVSDATTVSARPLLQQTTSRLFLPFCSHCVIVSTASPAFSDCFSSSQIAFIDFGRYFSIGTVMTVGQRGATDSETAARCSHTWVKMATKALAARSTKNNCGQEFIQS